MVRNVLVSPGRFWIHRGTLLPDGRMHTGANPRSKSAKAQRQQKVLSVTARGGSILSLTALRSADLLNFFSRPSTMSLSCSSMLLRGAGALRAAAAAAARAAASAAARSRWARCCGDCRIGRYPYICVCVKRVLWG